MYKILWKRKNQDKRVKQKLNWVKWLRKDLDIQMTSALLFYLKLKVSNF